MPGAISRWLLMSTTSLSSIQQPLTDPTDGTVTFSQFRRYESAIVRWGFGPKPAIGAMMPCSMPWMSELRMTMSFAM